MQMWSSASLAGEMRVHLWKRRIAASKFAKVKDFAQNTKGRIQIQDHGSRVWFRNITIKPLEPAD